MDFYLHAGRIPEGYRKDTGRVTDPLTDLLTDPLTDLLTDPLTDLLKDLLTKPSIEGPDWKTEAGLETRPAGRIPEGFQTILVIWSPGPLWRPVKLRNVYFTCTLEGYQKGAIHLLNDPLQKSGVAWRLYLHGGRIPEGMKT